MYLHIIPQIYSEFSDLAITLVDVTIPELQLRLVGDVDLRLGRPFPNKNYLVACHKKQRRATEGFLVNVSTPVSAFTVQSRWALNADRVIEHVAHHPVLDQEFDLVSQNAVLWHQMEDDNGFVFRNRWPDADIYSNSPLCIGPKMNVLNNNALKKELPSVVDIASDQFLLKRTETLALPTVECQRLWVFDRGRSPTKELVFVAG